MSYELIRILAEPTMVAANITDATPTMKYENTFSIDAKELS
ncbi:hypothetical protein [Methylobacterium sp. 10]|nr:hypothetical protein [Methylobacterium sp. 10]